MNKLEFLIENYKEFFNIIIINVKWSNLFTFRKKGGDKDIKKEVVKDVKNMCMLAVLGAPGFFAYSFYNKYKKMIQ